MAWEFERVAGPFEGPLGGVVWDGQAVLFSLVLPSHVNSRLLRYDPRTGETTVFRKYSGRTIGLALSADGELYGCQNASRRIVHFEHDGSTRLLADRIGGHFHNQPRALVVDRQTRIWFSDPYGELPAMGPQVQGPLEHASVLRLERLPSRVWQIRRATHDTAVPAGVALSPDERTLYVSENSAEPGGLREIRAYPLRDDSSLGPYTVLHRFASDHRGFHRGADGLAVDADGNLLACAGWRQAGPGPLVYVFAPGGQLLESHPVPGDRPAFCAFGDPDLASLYVTTAEGALYRARQTGRRGYPRSSP